MKKKIMLFSSIALFAFYSGALAQEKSVSEPKIVEEVVETSVLNHKVQVGETMMMISRKYMLRPSDIYEINPGTAEGIQPNMILKIPAAKIRAKLKPEQKNNIRTEQIAIIRKYD